MKRLSDLRVGALVCGALSLDNAPVEAELRAHGIAVAWHARGATVSGDAAALAWLADYVGSLTCGGSDCSASERRAARVLRDRILATIHDARVRS